MTSTLIAFRLPSMFTRLRRPLRAAATLGIAFSVVVLGAGCSKEPTRWDKAAEAAKSAAEAPKAPVAEGGTLNKFFPPREFDGKKHIPTAEKPGYVESKLEEGGAEVGTLSISDVAGNPDAIAKYDTATDKVLAFPLTTTGKNKSSTLVGKRFQVAVMSTKLDAEARKAVLSKFDLSGLSGFNPPLTK
jgi:hypothetical protein